MRKGERGGEAKRKEKEREGRGQEKVWGRGEREERNAALGDALGRQMRVPKVAATGFPPTCSSYRMVFMFSR